MFNINSYKERIRNIVNKDISNKELKKELKIITNKCINEKIYSDPKMKKLINFKAKELRKQNKNLNIKKSREKAKYKIAQETDIYKNCYNEINNLVKEIKNSNVELLFYRKTNIKYPLSNQLINKMKTKTFQKNFEKFLDDPNETIKPLKILWDINRCNIDFLWNIFELYNITSVVKLPDITIKLINNKIDNTYSGIRLYHFNKRLRYYYIQVFLDIKVRNVGHVNFILIDNIYKIIYFYEPHGIFHSNINLQNNIINTIKKTLFEKNEKLKKYKFIEPINESCPTKIGKNIGIQKERPLCQTYSFYHFLIYVLNPQIQQKRYLEKKIIESEKKTDHKGMYLFLYDLYLHIYKKLSLSDKKSIDRLGEFTINKYNFMY